MATARRAKVAQPPDPLSPEARRAMVLALALVKDAEEAARRADDPDSAMAVLSGLMGVIYALEGLAITVAQHG